MKVSLNRYFKLALLTTALSLFISGQTLASERSPLQNLPPEMKAKILENIEEPQKYGAVMKDFKAAMEDALKTHTLHIKASQLTKDNVETLKQVGDLKLEIDNADDATMALIGQLTNIKEFVIFGSPQVTDTGLAHISGLTNLQFLNLFNAKITDNGLAHLSGLKNLKVLNLGQTRVSDAGLAHLSGLINLKELGLSRTNITGSGLAHLSGLNFEDIILSDTPITNEGLAGLSKLTFKYLFLTNDKITDAGLVHLYGLKNVKGIDLKGTEVTRAGIAELKKHLPNTDIISSD